MRHINTEDLVDYMDGRVSDEGKMEVENHLSKCNDCTELKDEIQTLVLRLQEDTSFEPPAELLQWGVNLFHDGSQQPHYAGGPGTVDDRKVF
jgi:hypothetical protein